MAAIPKHKPKTWRENQVAKILKIRKEIAETEKRLEKEYEKETGIITPDIKSNMPIIDPNKDLQRNPTRLLAPDKMPKGEHYLEDGKWKPILEAKHGKLIKGFPKLTKRGWK